MTIPQLSPTGSQNWRRPEKIKSSASQNKKTSGRFFLPDKKIKRPKSKKNRGRKIIGTLLPIFIFLILLGGVIGLGAIAWISRDLPDSNGVIDRSITVSTKIYDRKGETVLYDIHGDIKRTLIDLEEIPEHVVWATLAAEDRNFYTHKGFSITGIIRSVIKNITTGSRVGGSTLTQQFVKNAILTTEKTYTRKIKEILLAYQIEKKFEKEEILQMYFNEIPYGSVIYGVEAASQSFFNKSAKDLTIAEGAILAAIPQAPTFYSPYGTNRDRLIARQRWIINGMEELKYITANEAEKARAEKIIFKPLQDSIIAPHFVMYVREILSEKYGETFITQEGLKVYTSLDLDKQKIAEEAIKKGVEENGEAFQFTNASLVAIDPPTGEIIAMVGSVDYFNNEIDGQVNVSLRLRQPGSSLKPIIYTASFIQGFTPDTILYDVVTDFDASGTKPYEPKNYDLEEHGPVTIRKALAGSLNIPAVKATYLTGTDNVLDLADNLGYTTLTDRDRYGLSVVLGGGEVKLLEHVGAFSALAQEGIKHELTPILKIEDKNGRVLFEHKDQKKKVLEPEIARQITNILSDDSAREYVFGLGSKLTLPNRPVAAKTGTTNDYRDAWTIGYTPGLAAGVWVGNNNNTEMKRGAAGGVVAAPIWNYFMREALKDTSPQNFNAPKPVVTGKPVLDGQEAREIKIKIDTMSSKLATEFTPESTTKELNMKEAHNILYYVNKEDPQGDAPNNPETDPQFKKWEDPVLEWALDNGFDQNDNQEIPTEYDDIHLEQDQPNLIIVSPLPNQTITSKNLAVDIVASARRGIKEVDYYINGQLITSQNNASDIVLDVSDFNNSYNTLTVKAKDDLENTATQTIELNFLLPQIIPVLNWISPTNNQNINMPINLSANLMNWDKIKKIDLYYLKSGDTIEGYIDFITPSQANFSLLWDEALESGTYTIYGNIFTTSDKKYKSEELNIIIN